MAEIKIGEEVTLKGKVTEILIRKDETLYRVAIYENNAPNSWSNDLIVREKEIIRQA